MEPLTQARARCGKVLRQRARYNRLFDTLADLKRSVRARVQPLLWSVRKNNTNQTASPSG